MNKVLIVDASTGNGCMMSGLLRKAGYDPVAVESIEAGKLEAAKLPPGAVIVTGMRLHDGTAKEFIDWLNAENYKFPVLVIVENLSNPMDIVDVMGGENGAVGIIQRPAIDKQLVEEVVKYAKPEHLVLNLDNQLIPRTSKVWSEIEKKINDIAVTNANAIVLGESGVGKEQIARQIYHQSSRSQKPHIVIEAGSAALVGKHDPTSQHAEMYNRIKGYFETSAGGTMIVKNIHLLPFDKQSVLLHILENEHPDVRVICTAEPELLKMVKENTFRPNLFFILRQSDISVPSLKETTEDIPIIADYLLKSYAAKTGKQRKHLDASAIKALKLYPWPGNVRELKDVVLFAAFHAETDTISAEDLNFNHSEPIADDDLSLRNPYKDREKIIEAYRRGGNWKQAAKLLNVTEKTLISLRKKLGIDSSGDI